MTDPSNLLGEYLRARRELVTPAQAGIPSLGTRRVPGLRREEVAMLSGISAEYYLRLEQGRDRNPSLQVLDSIARVLLLDDETKDYLRSLAADKPRRPRPRARRETFPPSIGRLLGTITLPAFVEGRYLDVLGANPLATALSPRLTPGANRLRDVFLDSGEQALFPNWDQAAAGIVASFRQTVGSDTDDPRIIELVGELSLSSQRFRELWARHDVRGRQGAAMRFDHPQVGDLRLDREKLLIGGTDGIMLVIYHAEPGSESAEKLALLSSALPAQGDEFDTGRIGAHLTGSIENHH